MLLTDQAQGKVIALFQDRSLNRASCDLPGKVPLDRVTFETAFSRLKRDQTAGKHVGTGGITLGGETVRLAVAVGLKAGVWRQN